MGILKNKDTAVRLIKEGIERIVTQKVEDEIVSKMVSDFESRAREVVKAEVSKVTIDNVQMFVDHMRLSEEIEVRLNWSDE